MNAKRFAVVLVAAGACGAGASAEPELLVRAFERAAAQGDVAARRRMTVSPDRVRAALACPAGASVIDAVATVHENLALERPPSGASELEVSVDSLDETFRAVVEPGSKFRGCTANQAFEVRAYLVRVTIKHGPTAHHEAGPTEVIRLDGAWWILPD